MSPPQSLILSTFRRISKKMSPEVKKNFGDILTQKRLFSYYAGHHRPGIKKIVFLNLFQQIDHFNGRSHGIETLISGFRSSSFHSLLDRIGGQDAENHRHSGL